MIFLGPKRLLFFWPGGLRDFFVAQDTACSFGKIDVLGGKWLSFVFRVHLKVVNKAFSMFS